MGDIVPRKTLVNQLLVGAGGIIGGIVTFALGGMGIPGIILGGIAAVLGISGAFSKDNKLPGYIAAGAGIVVILANLHFPILGGLSGFLLGAGGIALLALGGFSLFKFIKNMMKRM
jgi:hypothetical protein